MEEKGLNKWLNKQRSVDAACGLILLSVIFGGWFFSGVFVGYLLWNT